MRLPRSKGRGLAGFILRASFRMLRISSASRGSMPRSEPRAYLAIGCKSLIFFQPAIKKLVVRTAMPKSRPTPVLFALDEKYFFRVVHFAKLDLDDLAAGGLDFSSHVHRLDGQLAVSAIDQDT